MTTPDPTPARAAFDAYVASVQAQISDLSSKVADLNTKLAALGPEIVEFSDFAELNYAPLATTSVGKLLPAVVVGKGVDRTIYRMKPGSSTKASKVPTSGTNPFTLLRVGGNDSAHVVTGIDLGGFTLQGTDQGHLFNGLMIGYSTGARLHDVAAHAIPGSSNEPPGETFTVNLWHANGALLERVVLTGDGVAASLFGINNLVGVTLTNCKATGAVYGMGFTGWKSSDITLTDCDLSGNRRPLNFEQCGGSINLTRVDMRRAGHLPHVTVNGNLSSAKVTITDPKVDAWPIKVGVSSQPYQGLPQLQKVSDVRLIVAGKDVSADKTMLACGDVW